MNITQNIFGSLTGWLRVVWLAALVALAWPVEAANLQLPTLRTKHGTFTNVTITGKTESDIYVRHDGGIGNVKLSDIDDDEALIALGLKERPVKVETVEPAEVTTPSETNAVAKVVDPAAHYKELALERLQYFKEHLPGKQIILAIVVAQVVLYLFFCFCLKLICLKAGSNPGVLVWVPLLNAIPAFRAAGMSGWWLVALFVPLLNLVATILWCFKITSARGKSIGVAILLLLPVLNLFAFLYLAFADAAE